MHALEGLTVVSIEQAVAAPFATRQLADLGARVIKIERPDAPLRAGEIITTGVLTDAHPVAPGETWRTELTGLHGLRITFS